MQPESCQMLWQAQEKGQPLPSQALQFKQGGETSTEETTRIKLPNI